MPLFCRHNRFLQNCPICSREEAAKRPQAPPPRTRTQSSSGPSGTRKPSRQRASGVVVRRAARAADDGYSNPLVPGIRGSADARRLAALVDREVQRLETLGVEPPPPWDAVVEAADPGEAADRAMRIVLGAVDGGPSDPADQRAYDAYEKWLERSGGPEAAFTGDESWTPERRFDRIFDRLAFPNFGRARRFDLLVNLGATDWIPMAPGGMKFGTAGGDDAATLAAKRVLNSGDPMLLDRRALALVEALGTDLAPLDGALEAFENGEDPDASQASERLDTMTSALGL